MNTKLRKTLFYGVLTISLFITFISSILYSLNLISSYEVMLLIYMVYLPPATISLYAVYELISRKDFKSVFTMALILLVLVLNISLGSMLL